MPKIMQEDRQSRIIEVNITHDYRIQFAAQFSIA
jgi:hypothetical protein